MHLIDKQLTDILQTAKELGFRGFSGNCFSAAIAILKAINLEIV